jgi:hypothetical protein
MASLSNILLSKTYIPDGGSTIRVSFRVSDEQTQLDAKYQIYLNDVLLKENSLTATPYSVNENVFLSTGGILKISLIDSNNVTTDWTYELYDENRDTFTIQRRLEYDTSTILNNAKIVSGEGVTLDNSNTGELLIEVPTVGKAKLSSIVIDGNTDGQQSLDIEMEPSQIVELDDYTEYTYPIEKTKYDGINSFTLDDTNNILNMNVNVHRNKEIQLSKDGINFVGYDGVIWNPDVKMSEADVEALTESDYSKFHNTAYEERLFIKVGLDSNNTVDPILVSKITSRFADNQPPIVQNMSLSLSSIHDEETFLSAKMIDSEGDRIEYRVMIKKANSFDFEQAIPASGWIEVTNNTDITHALNKDYFELGTNNIKIQTRDHRGAVKDSQVLDLQFINSAPIQVSYICTDFNLQALINDENGDDVAYRILINGVQKFPTEGYTAFEPTPRLIDYSWDSSDLIFGLNNEIILEVIDPFKGVLQLKSNVIGTYKGLLFKDEYGNYYSTDKAEILKYIDLGQHTAGSLTTPKRVILENHTGESIGNVKIKVSDETVYEGIDMTISHTLTPYNGTKELVIPYTLNDKDTFNFYVRVKLDRFVEKTGEVLLKLEVE